MARENKRGMLNCKYTFQKALKSTPFRLMFGRDFNPAYLFRANSIEFEEVHSSDISDESAKNESNYDPLINSSEWIEMNDSSRSTECELARSNIQQDQARQKIIFDSKVQRNRFESITFIYSNLSNSLIQLVVDCIDK